MTTKLKIEITQAHMPVMIEVLRSDGTVLCTQTLGELGSASEQYVHSGQSLHIREMTTNEMHSERLQAVT